LLFFLKTPCNLKKWNATKLKNVKKLQKITKNKILVICDDLTGCGDIAYWGFDSGLKQKIYNLNNLKSLYSLENIKKFDDFDILIINTETRFAKQKTIQKKLNYISKWAKTKNFKIIFKKIDSTLRGNFITEIDILIKNFDINYLPFVAGYPDYGRKTINGYHYVNNKILHETEFAKDPKNPIIESHIPTIIKNQSKFSKISKIYHIYDITKNTDFNKVIKNISNQYKKNNIAETKIFAGTAKFFGEILKSFNPSINPKKKQQAKSIKPLSTSKINQKFDNLLIVAGSFNVTTKKQLDTFYNKFSLSKLAENKNYAILSNNNKNIYALESPRVIYKKYSLASLIKKTKELLKSLGQKKNLDNFYWR